MGGKPSAVRVNGPLAAYGRDSSSTISTASRRNSGGSFDGRPTLDLVFINRGILLYEVSAQLGDAQSAVTALLVTA